MKYKEYHFDVEMIIDHNVEFMGETQQISTHHTMRGYKLQELIEIIKLNNVPLDSDIKITFNIRGVNY